MKFNCIYWQVSETICLAIWTQKIYFTSILISLKHKLKTSTHLLNFRSTRLLCDMDPITHSLCADYLSCSKKSMETEAYIVGGLDFLDYDSLWQPACQVNLVVSRKASSVRLTPQQNMNIQNWATTTTSSNEHECNEGQHCDQWLCELTLLSHNTFQRGAHQGTILWEPNNILMKFANTVLLNKHSNETLKLGLPHPATIQHWALPININHNTRWHSWDTVDSLIFARAITQVSWGCENKCREICLYMNI